MPLTRRVHHRRTGPPRAARGAVADRRLPA